MGRASRPTLTPEMFLAECAALPTTEKGCREYPGRASWKGYPERHVVGHKSDRLNRTRLEIKLGRPLLPGMFACHSCDNPRCVEETHLYEGTPKKNSEDMVKRLRNTRTAKLTEEAVIEIRRRWHSGTCTQSELGLYFNVTQAQISNIVLNRQWRHLLSATEEATVA